MYISVQFKLIRIIKEIDKLTKASILLAAEQGELLLPDGEDVAQLMRRFQDFLQTQGPLEIKHVHFLKWNIKYSINTI